MDERLSIHFEWFIGEILRGKFVLIYAYLWSNEGSLMYQRLPQHPGGGGYNFVIIQIRNTRDSQFYTSMWRVIHYQCFDAVMA